MYKYSTEFVGELAVKQYIADAFTDMVFHGNQAAVCNHRFSNDPGIRCVHLPDSIRELGVGAFSGCVNLESVELNEGLKRLKKETFSGCVKLEDVRLPDTLESIGEWAFRGCANLKTIVIPNNVREICAEAFLSCPDLTIIAEEGSFAAAFAEQYGIKYIEVNNE